MEATSAAPSARSVAEYFPIVFCIVFWAWNTPMYKYLQVYDCDEYTMSFYRTVTAAAAVTGWELALSGPRAMWLEAKRLNWRFVIFAFLFMGGMFAGVKGAFLTNATLAILLSRATPLVALTISAIFYLDERRLIRRPDFLLGFGLAFVGLLGLSLMRAPAEPAAQAVDNQPVTVADVNAEVQRAGSAVARAAAPTAAPVVAVNHEKEHTLGVLLLLACALMWGTYSVVVKGMVIGARPFTITSLTFWLASAMALPFMLLYGQPGWLWRTDLLPVLVMLLSGVLMGVAEGLFYLSVNRLGLAPSTSATLLVPFMTALIAWQFLDEKITWSLVGFGVLLLTGLGTIVYARTRLLSGERLQRPILMAGRAGIAPLTIGQTAKEES